MDYLQHRAHPDRGRRTCWTSTRARSCYLPATGKALVMHLAPAHAEALVAQDRAGAQRRRPVATVGSSSATKLGIH